MASMRTEHTIASRTFASQQYEIDSLLAEKSLVHGGAWCWCKQPFAPTISFLRYATPSRVPDRLLDCWNGGLEVRIGWKGKVIQFSNAAKIREQNRGLTCE
jgi:hypothetical protein